MGSIAAEVTASAVALEAMYPVLTLHTPSSPSYLPQRMSRGSLLQMQCVRAPLLLWLSE